MEELSLRKSMHRFTLLGILGVFLIIGTIGAWATMSEISGAVIASGKLVVEGNSKRIQHAEGGIVEDIRVKDGDMVEPDQILVVLDETDARAELGIVRSAENELMARIARLEAESNDRTEIIFPEALRSQISAPEIQDLVSSQKKLFATQRRAIEGRKKQLDKRIDQFRREITGIMAQKQAIEDQSILIAEELAGNQALLEKGLVQKPRVLSLSREASRLKGQRGQLIAQIARVEGQIAEIELQMIQLGDEVRSRAMTEWREAEARLQETRERLTTVSARLERITIKAPRAGIVQELAVHTIGGVIRAGETIMKIVPEERTLVIETKLRPQDIDQVHTGQQATLRFANANNRMTPQIQGRVLTISADLQQDREDLPPYYLVHLQGDKNDMLGLNDLVLKPGMPVEAFIQTETRSPLSYLIKPMSDQMARAFREK